VAHIGETLVKGQHRGKGACRGDVFWTSCASNTVQFPSMGTDDRIVAGRCDVTEDHIGILLQSPSWTQTARSGGLEVRRARTVCAHGAKNVREWILLPDGNASKARGTPRDVLRGQRKVAPIGLLSSSLTEFGLAVWIMDDGAADGKQLRINTQSFSVDEAEQLARLIRAKFGIVMSVNRDKSRPRLRCGAAGMDRLVGLVRHHTIPSMLYKLSL
jgi:hypothetical protein